MRKILSFLSALLICGGLQAIDIEPYLQSVTPNSIYVNWIGQETESKVIYGTSKESLSREKQGTYNEFCSFKYHTVQLNELEPNTKYYYQVISGQKHSGICNFRTLPQPGQAVTADGHIRFLIMGDNQLNNDRYFKFVAAAKAKVLEKWGGDPSDNIASIIMVGDQVDAGNCEQYKNIHFERNKALSPYLPIQTLLGNHEVSSIMGLAGFGGVKELQLYKQFFILNDGDMLYKPELYGEKYKTEDFYAHQMGNLLYIGFNTEAPSTDELQMEWLKKIVAAADKDNTVDWIISSGHRPYRSEQYYTDVHKSVQEKFVPFLAESDKYLMHIGAHHHLYSRGQLKEKPVYHIISGGTAWDQYWGDTLEEKDQEDIQKTLTEWAYQIVDVDIANGKVDVECYSIGTIFGYYSKDKLIDSFHRYKGQSVPLQPEIVLSSNKDLPIVATSTFKPGVVGEELNSSQFLIAKTEDFSRVIKEVYRDFENFYGRGDRKDKTVDRNKGVDITQLTISADVNTLPNGNYYIKVRHRDKNLEWSEWSKPLKFEVTNSTPAIPEVSVEKNSYRMNDTVNVSFSESATASSLVDKGAWIGLYDVTQKPEILTIYNKAWAWEYTQAKSNGIVSFTNFDTVVGNIKYDFEPGIYYAQLFSKGYKKSAHSKSFYVGDEIILDIDNNEFKKGDTVRLTYKNAPVVSGNSLYRKQRKNKRKDNISIYKKGEDKPIVIERIGDKSSDSLLLTNLPKGYYFAETKVIETPSSVVDTMQYIDTEIKIGNTVAFKVGEGLITELSLDKGKGTETDRSMYYLGEPIVPNWKDAPGIVKDWIGIYKEGYRPDQSTDPNSGYSYTYFNGLAQGSIEIPQKNLPKEPGEYYMAIFTNDLYLEVSNRVHFTVVACPTVEDMETTVCSGEQFEIKPTLDSIFESKVKFSWEAPKNIEGLSGLEKGQKQESIHGSLVNSTAEAISVNYIVSLDTPMDCGQKTFTITFNVKAQPYLQNIDTVTVCKGESLDLRTLNIAGKDSLELTYYNAIAATERHEIHKDSLVVKPMSDTLFYVVGKNNDGCESIPMTIPIVLSKWETPVTLSSNISDNKIEKNQEITFLATGGKYYEFYVNGNIVQGKSEKETYTTTKLQNEDEVTVRVFNENDCNKLTNSLKITVLDNSLKYCENASENSDSEWISTVRIADYEKQSGASNYTDNTNEFIQIKKEQIYTLEVEIGYEGHAYKENLSVFIDWNEDGDFDDAEELIALKTREKYKVRTNFQVPQGTLLGEKRMRIVLSYGNFPMPCGRFLFGESEDYTLTVIDGDTGDENPEPLYCESFAKNSVYEWIETVKVGKFVNKSKATNYSDFTDKIIELGTDGSNEIMLFSGYSGFFFPQTWSVWIDWNRDGDFDDIEESVTKGISLDGYFYEQFDVPNMAKLGTTRMRIAMKYGKFSSPCSVFMYGEVEDYTVNIVQGQGEIITRSSNVSADGDTEWIPNFISPNNDGVNDSWELCGIKGYLLEVFNVQGQRVYLKKNYMQDKERFVGKAKNSAVVADDAELSEGVYYYLLSSPNTSDKKQGILYLER